jgi:hypothetical protein
MTSLPDAIGRTLDAAFAASRLFPPPPVADQLRPDVLLHELVRQFGGRGHGGTRQMARETGIDRRTIQRAVARGAAYKPTPSVLDKLRRAYEDIRRPALERERQDKIGRARASTRASLTTKGGNGPVIKGTICVSNDCRPRRTLDMSTVFTGSTRRAIVAAYEAGDLERAGNEFEAGLNKDYCETDLDPYEPGAMYVQDVDWLRWS